ncbi:DUF3265 domain-containing protein [Vibrio vulnificus]|uniref:DUF3265 domain-containing protein n=1 Tax=Vibrio vulnificus TaxID=672 RepID=A0AAW4HG57_VIBVL|nr:DUF3265 domain-containing protein [Vibrio vulnificus]ELA3117396.1 DUF3265 domain-containing protein [Vibrio vulnificus]ELV8613374.1 DUF3265 domain-containing protein [Vibrio vulnificus]ELV8766272.1 DUF3265 domain-containing protein [Vibrio vulnificus]EMB7845102.1 DUF3265 domain-containing protein [Vibrio vulnificus]
MTRRLSGIHAEWHFLYAVGFGGESGLRKVGLGGIHPLNAGLVPQRKQSIRREFLFLVEDTQNSDDIALDPVRDNHRNLRNNE